MPLACRSTNWASGSRSHTRRSVSLTLALWSHRLSDCDRLQLSPKRYMFRVGECHLSYALNQRTTVDAIAQRPFQSPNKGSSAGLSATSRSFLTPLCIYERGCETRCEENFCVHTSCEKCSWPSSVYC